MKNIIIIILTFVVMNVWAQEETSVIKYNSLNLDFGLNQIKEENLHPKVHSGIFYELKYEQTKQIRNISTFSIDLGFSRLKTKYEDLSATANVKLHGSYNYLFETANNNKLSNHLGPEIRLAYDLSLYPNWDESHLYWANYLAFGIKNKLKYEISEKQSLLFNLNLSLFSVFSRPELDRQYKIDEISFGGILKSMHSNLEAGIIDRSFFVFFQMEYQFHISEKFTQAIIYSYGYTRLKSKEGLPFQDNLHNIGFKVYFL